MEPESYTAASRLSRTGEYTARIMGAAILIHFARLIAIHGPKGDERQLFSFRKNDQEGHILRGASPIRWRKMPRVMPNDGLDTDRLGRTRKVSCSTRSKARKSSCLPKSVLRPTPRLSTWKTISPGTYLVGGGIQSYYPTYLPLSSFEFGGYHLFFSHLILLREKRTTSAYFSWSPGISRVVSPVTVFQTRIEVSF